MSQKIYLTLFTTTFFLTSCVIGSNLKPSAKENQIIEPSNEFSSINSNASNNNELEGSEKQLSPKSQAEKDQNKLASNNEVDKANLYDSNVDHSFLKNLPKNTKNNSQPTSIYDRLRSGFVMDQKIDHPKVKKYIKHYQKYPNQIIKSLERSTPFIYHIVKELQSRQMPLELALLPIVESNFKVTARSHRNAVGLWQFIGSTGRAYGLESNWWYEGRHDVIKSTTAALDFLTVLNSQNNGDWEKSLASYNAGYGAIIRATKKFKRLNGDLEPTYWDLDLPLETKNYVPKLLALVAIISEPNLYGIELPEIVNFPVIKVVKVNKQLDLRKVSEAIEMKPKYFVALNPAYKRNTTLANTDNFLILPISKAKEFEQLMLNSSKKFQVKNSYYIVKKGDSLSEIAEKYDVTVSQLMKLNKLNNTLIYANKKLIVPAVKVNSDQEYAKKSAKKDKLNQPVPKVSKKVINKHANKIFREKTKQTKQKSLQTEAFINVAQSNNKFYEVVSGDSLYSIAKKLEVSVEDLKLWNPYLSEQAVLKIGQELTINSSKLNQKNKKSNTKGQIFITHKIRHDESLWQLAQKYNVAVADIKIWNDLKNSRVYVGDKLLIKLSS